MKATKLQLFTAQLQLFEYNNAAIWITFPESKKYQMTRYYVTDSNFLWIADCCILRTFSTRIISVFYFWKKCTYFYVFYFIIHVFLNSGPLDEQKLDCWINKTANSNVKKLNSLKRLVRTTVAMSHN